MVLSLTVAHKVALSSRIGGDIAQQLSERLGLGDRRPRWLVGEVKALP
jgi:hypothetical protein